MFHFSKKKQNTAKRLQRSPVVAFRIVCCARSHQLKLDVRRVDAAEHGYMLGGQLWREHAAAADSRHASHTANTPNAPTGRGHLLQHGAWHLRGEKNTMTGTRTLPQALFSTVTKSNHVSFLLPDEH